MTCPSRFPLNDVCEVASVLTTNTPQNIRLKMKDLVPMNLTTWDKKALDLLHATLVDRHLKVEVDGEAKNPMDANVFIGNIDIGKMLVANGFARRRGDFDNTLPREEMY